MGCPPLEPTKKEANKMYDSSDKQPEKKKKGRPPVRPKFRQYIIQMAKDNPPWGNETCPNIMKKIHIQVSPSFIRSILNKVGIYPAPDRDQTQTWHEFLISKNPGNLSM